MDPGCTQSSYIDIYHDCTYDTYDMYICDMIQGHHILCESTESY